jgi:hypothetical protein
MTTVVILQSNYLPWKGYFDLIHDADVFIFYDDVQYTKNDWRNRNKIKTAGGTCWLTVPVAARLDRNICEIALPPGSWKEKHWKSIRQYYSRAPHFARYEAFFAEMYLSRRWQYLSELNQYLIRSIARDHLGITTILRDSREFTATGNPTERLIALIHAVEGKRYLSGPSARDYLQEELFHRAGIELAYKDYRGYPEYKQFFPPFESAVSIVDLLCHTGPDAPEYIWGWRHRNPIRKSA